MSGGIVYQCGSDLELLWLWHRQAAVAPIRPLAWELKYATGEAPPKKNLDQTIFCSNGFKNKKWPQILLYRLQFDSLRSVNCYNYFRKVYDNKY